MNLNMKSIKNFSLLIIAVLIVFGLNSCKKENGLQSFTKSVSSWSCDSYACDAFFTIPEITSDIIDKGVVLVYMNADQYGQVALPFLEFVYLINPGSLQIRSVDGNGNIPTFNQYKVVIIENWKSRNLQNIDKNDFKAVSKIASKIINVNLEK